VDLDLGGERHQEEEDDERPRPAASRATGVRSTTAVTTRRCRVARVMSIWLGVMVVASWVTG